MQMSIVSQNGHVLGTYSWVEGFVSLKCPHRKLCEDDVLAHALWLERHVSSEAGAEFIERWEQGVLIV